MFPAIIIFLFYTIVRFPKYFIFLLTAGGKVILETSKDKRLDLVGVCGLVGGLPPAIKKTIPVI